MPSEFSKTGILLINLGTPDTPTTLDIRRFLKEFLSDPRVIDLPWLIRTLLLHIIILPFRPKKIQHAYKQIWTEHGSPLLFHSKQLTEALQKKIETLDDRYEVALAMRYGTPSIAQGIHQLMTAGCTHLKILPLFPQFSSAATGSVIEECLTTLQTQRNLPTLHIYGEFSTHPAFIQAYADVISTHLRFTPDLYLFSYHGLPERQLIKSGCNLLHTCQTQNSCPPLSKSPAFCYRAQSYATSHSLAQALGLSSSQYTVGFQSRLGRTPWIQPYVDELLPKLATQGIKKLAVVCPSFVTDCLETLEEIGIQAKQQWKMLGGEDFQIIPCLNAEPIWVEALLKILEIKSPAQGEAFIKAH